MMGRGRKPQPPEELENVEKPEEELKKKIGKLYKTSELARVLRVSNATILSYIKEGLLKATKIRDTSTYLIKEKDLDEFLEKIFGDG